VQAERQAYAINGNGNSDSANAAQDEYQRGQYHLDYDFCRCPEKYGQPDGKFRHLSCNDFTGTPPFDLFSSNSPSA
jgi:hypothetical protein